MKTVPEILDGFGADYTVVPCENGAIVLFLFPYRPFEPFPPGHLYLDNYFFVSHESYQKVNRLLETLRAAGFAATRYRAEPLKDLALRAGRAERCKNDLVWNRDYGSYFYIDAIMIPPPDPLPEGRGRNSPLRSEGVDAAGGRGSCNLCISACPTGALSENGFERRKCIRQFMEKKHEPTTAERALIGDRLLGCEICRAACPHNAHLRPLPVPPEVLAATKKGVVDYPKIRQWIGSNLL
jgi:ferredoxin